MARTHQAYPPEFRGRRARPSASAVMLWATIDAMMVFGAGYVLTRWRAGWGRLGNIMAMVLLGPLLLGSRAADYARCGAEVPLRHRSGKPLGAAAVAVGVT